MHSNLTFFRWLQPKLGNDSLCHPHQLCFPFSFPPAPWKGCFFLDTLLLDAEKSLSLTAVLLPSDINTMKEIIANFCELSHHLQLINSCCQSRHWASPLRAFTSSATLVVLTSASGRTPHSFPLYPAASIPRSAYAQPEEAAWS